MRREDLARSDCGIAQSLGVLGDWWTVLLVREVAGGVTRFNDLQAELGISRRALTERLAGLVDAGVLRTVPYSARPPRHDYVLTERGQGLLPVLVALQEFGDRHLLGDGSLTATATAGSGEVERVRALVGRSLPDLALPATTGGSERLVPRGRWRVVYLFPGAFAPTSRDALPPDWSRIPGAGGCTLESSTYAARHADFVAAGADVVGVSTQRPDEQRAFAEHAALPFPLLADQDARLGAGLRLPLFRVAGLDRYKRQSLLVDPDGTVVAVQVPITDPAGSVAEMLSLVTGLRGRTPVG